MSQEERDNYKVNGYTFSYVTADHTITVKYSEDRNGNDTPDDEENHYTVTATAGANGSVSPAGATDVI